MVVSSQREEVILQSEWPADFQAAGFFSLFSLGYFLNSPPNCKLDFTSNDYLVPELVYQRFHIQSLKCFLFDCIFFSINNLYQMIRSMTRNCLIYSTTTLAKAVSRSWMKISETRSFVFLVVAYQQWNICFSVGWWYRLFFINFCFFFSSYI